MRQTAAACRVSRENGLTFTAHNKDYRTSNVPSGWLGFQQRLKAAIFTLSGVAFLYYYASFVAFHELSTSSSSINNLPLSNTAPISSSTTVGIRHNAELTAAAEVVAAAWTELAVATQTHPKASEKPVPVRSTDPPRITQVEPQQEAAAKSTVPSGPVEAEAPDELQHPLPALRIAETTPLQVRAVEPPLNRANSAHLSFAKNAPPSATVMAAEVPGSSATFNTTRDVATPRLNPDTSTARWDAATQDWAGRITAKAACLKSRRASSSNSGVAFFLYHMRKAAGTTVRTFLEKQCRSASTRRGRHLLRAPAGVEGCLFESEGLSLPPGTLRALEGGAVAASSHNMGSRGGETSRRGPLVVTVTTLRHPVDRALSLYWYVTVK